MDAKKRQPLGVELVRRGIVKEKDIEDALEYQIDHPTRKIGDILYILNACDPTILIEAIGDILGEKGIILNSNTIKVKMTEYFSLDVAKKNKAIPFEVLNRKNKSLFCKYSKQ